MTNQRDFTPVEPERIDQAISDDPETGDRIQPQGLGYDTDIGLYTKFEYGHHGIHADDAAPDDDIVPAIGLPPLKALREMDLKDLKAMAKQFDIEDAGSDKEEVIQSLRDRQAMGAFRRPAEVDEDEEVEVVHRLAAGSPRAAANKSAAQKAKAAASKPGSKPTSERAHREEANDDAVKTESDKDAGLAGSPARRNTEGTAAPAGARDPAAINREVTDSQGRSSGPSKP